MEKEDEVEGDLKNGGRESQDGGTERGEPVCKGAGER